MMIMVTKKELERKTNIIITIIIIMMVLLNNNKIIPTYHPDLILITNNTSLVNKYPVKCLLQNKILKREKTDSIKVNLTKLRQKKKSFKK